MALDRENLKALMAASVKKDVAKNYSYEGATLTQTQIDAAVAKELSEIAFDYNKLHDNGRRAFALITETIDEVLPNRVIEQYGQFAEVRTFAQGDKPVFYQRISTASRTRARQFITKVGLAGRYEVFKLDGRSYTVPTSAFGGAVQVAFEEVLDGRVTMADVLDIALEALDRALFIEIERALVAAANALQPANKYTSTTWIEDDFDQLLQVADSYGSGKSTIYCTFEFAATMIPAQNWVSDRMKDELWNTGYFTTYKQHPVVVLAQTFEDTTNSVKTMDPAYCFIIPGGAEKPVKVALEGPLQMKAHDNDDWSQEIEMYKKMGVVAQFQTDVCVYRNTSLVRQRTIQTDWPVQN
jgi:hypothetical protein